MELLVLVLVWIGVLTQEQTHYVTNSEARDMFSVHKDQIEVEYPDEYSIIMTDENEVN